MSKYKAEIQSAYDAIEAAGQRMTLHRLKFNAVPYDPVTPPTADKVVDISTSGSGVVLPASNGTIEAFDNRILQDPQQRRSFRFVILAAKGLTFEPQANDVLKTAEGFYRVLGATPLNPDGAAPIIFNVGCTLDLEPFTRPA